MKTKHTRGLVGCAPVNGRYFFIHRESRCVRAWDIGCLPICDTGGWEQVSLEEWEAFRKETRAISPKKRKALHALLYKSKEVTECPKLKKSPKQSTKPTRATSPSKRASTRSASPRASARKKASK